MSLPKSASRKIDVVFLSPPWGGPSYLSGIEPTTPTPVHHEYSLDSIQPIPGADLFHLSRRITPNIAYYLPRNTKLEEVGKLVGAEESVGLKKRLVWQRRGRQNKSKWRKSGWVQSWKLLLVILGDLWLDRAIYFEPTDHWTKSKRWLYYLDLKCILPCIQLVSSTLLRWANVKASEQKQFWKSATSTSNFHDVRVFVNSSFSETLQNRVESY